MKYSTRTLIGLIMLVVFSAPAANAVKLSVSSDDVSISSVYNLADSTSLHEETMVLDGGIVQSRQASGSGRNELKQHISGSDYKVNNILRTSGDFRSSTSTIAAENAAVVSQDLSANGDSLVELYGVSGAEEAGQYAGANDARVQSSQALFIAGDVMAGQNTAIKGGAGMMGSSAASGEKNFEVSGGFSGDDGSLDARLVSVASESANMYGTASITGVECLNDEVLGFLSSGKYSMHVDGLYAAGDGNLGLFGLNAINGNNEAGAVRGPVNGQSAAQLINSGSHPEIVASPPGDPNSFVLWQNSRIDPARPLQLYLKTDTNLKNEKLSATAVNQALASATNTWDYWTKPGENNLFKPTVINDASKKAYTIDGYNVHAFQNVNSYFIAVARTICDDKGYVIDADVNYNTRATWTTDWNKAVSGNGLDFQTVALHELGHTCGLGDLYTLSDGDPRKGDLKEIMNYYSYPQHYLGAGDIKGVQTLYGA